MNRNLVVIGQGYVGLPLAEAAAAANYRVTGLELNERTVSTLNAGSSHVGDISDAALAQMLERGYSATTDTSCLASADVVVICVPTPLGEDGAPDLSAVRSASRAIVDNPGRNALVVLESTTYPGTTDDVVLPILESAGARHGSDFHLAFSPERVNPGDQTYGIRNTPKLVGGVDAEATTRAVDFYSDFIETVVPLKGTREAETAKLLENTYRHINIALVNEMARFCHDLDIDIWEVIRGASTKPFGFQAFYPGPGVGGHCIPIDPNYLSYQVKKTLGYQFRFVELAQEINNSMPNYVVSRVQDLLNDRGLPLRGSRVLLVGVTYKPDVADQRESPARPIAKLLRARGAIVSYHDPFVDTWVCDGRPLHSEADPYGASGEADVTVVLQNHSDVTLEKLAENARVLFDTTGATADGLAHRL